MLSMRQRSRFSRERARRGAAVNYYKVLIREYAGYECDGHIVPYIVAASNEQEAIVTAQKASGKESSEYESCGQITIPDLKRRRAPFVL